MKMSKIVQFLTDAVTFYLATMDGDQARVRPFGAVAEIEGKIYLCTGNPKDVYKQMMANPKVEISAMVGERWIRLTGEVARDERPEAKAAMLEACPTLKDIYTLEDGVFEVFYFTKGTAAFCSFTSEPEIVHI